MCLCVCFLYLYLCVCICVVTEYTLNLSFPTPPFCLIATPQVRVIAVAKVVLLAIRADGINNFGLQKIKRFITMMMWAFTANNYYLFLSSKVNISKHCCLSASVTVGTERYCVCYPG